MSKNYDDADDRLIRRLYYLLCMPTVTTEQLDEVAAQIEPCVSCGERFESLDEDGECGSCKELDA